MAFVNEFVSEDEIRTHDLDGLMNSYNRHSFNPLPHAGFRHGWTIDRDRAIYFIPVQTITATGRSGREEPTSQTRFVLDWQAKRIEVVLGKSPEGSIKFNTVPFIVIWELVKIDPPELPDLSHDEMLRVLRQAVHVFGYDGIKLQIPNLVVECRF